MKNHRLRVVIPAVVLGVCLTAFCGCEKQEEATEPQENSLQAKTTPTPEIEQPEQSVDEQEEKITAPVSDWSKS